MPRPSVRYRRLSDRCTGSSPPCACSRERSILGDLSPQAAPPREFQESDGGGPSPRTDCPDGGWDARRDGFVASRNLTGVSPECPATTVVGFRAKRPSVGFCRRRGSKEERQPSPHIRSARRGRYPLHPRLGAHRDHHRDRPSQGFPYRHRCRRFRGRRRRATRCRRPSSTCTAPRVGRSVHTCALTTNVRRVMSLASRLALSDAVPRLAATRA
jgi:hypothetical protein